MSKVATQNTKDSTVANTLANEALDTVLNIMRTDRHKDQLRAAQEVLNRLHGPVDKPAPLGVKIVEQFLNEELSASDSKLLIEAVGGNVPLRIKGQAIREESSRRVRALNHRSKRSMAQARES